MRTISNILPLYVLSTVVLLSSCTGNGGVPVDFTDTLYSPSYAQNFLILGSPGSKSTIIEVKNPWQGADSILTHLFICRDGENVPSGFTGSILQGNASRVVAMSSTDIALLDAFGASDRVVGVSGIDYIANADIQKRRANIGDVGFEGNVNYETLLSLQPDIVLLYGVGSASVMEGKLRELEIPYIYVGDYLEQSPVGKAEWMIPLGEIVGMRESAVQVFDSIPVRYERVRQLASTSAAQKPKVMLNTPYGDSWFMPPVSSYMVRLIEDAGGKYMFTENTGTVSMPIDMEQASLLLSEADVWLNVTDFSSLGQLKKALPKIADAHVLKAGKCIFGNNRRVTTGGGNDFFESGVVHPDVVLLDLVKILHPDLLSDHELVYYKELQE